MDKVNVYIDRYVHKETYVNMIITYNNICIYMHIGTICIV